MFFIEKAYPGFSRFLDNLLSAEFLPRNSVFCFRHIPPKLSDLRHIIQFRHIYTSRIISWLKQAQNQRLWAYRDIITGQQQVFRKPHPTFSYPPYIPPDARYGNPHIVMYCLHRMHAPSDFYFLVMCDYGAEISAKLGFPKTDRDFLAICKTLHILENVKYKKLKYFIKKRLIYFIKSERIRTLERTISKDAKAPRKEAHYE